MRPFSLIALLVLLTACSPDTPAVEEDTAVSQASTPTSVSFDSEIAGSEVTSITTEGGEVRLGLTDEVLYVGLTEKVAAEVEKELDAAESEGGLGGFIAGAVSNAVTGALATPVQIPLDDVSSVRYESGRLEIDLEGEHASADLEINDEPVAQQFAPEDARRFAEAFHELTGR